MNSRESTLNTPLYEDRFSPDRATILGELDDLLVYLDGEFVTAERAAVSLWDHGLLYGDGAFEGIRVYDGAIYKLDAHLKRLYESCAMLALDVPLTPAELGEVIVEVVARNGLRDAHVRPIVTRGMGLPGFDPKRCPRASVVVLAYPFGGLHGDGGQRLMVSSIRRKAPGSVDSRIKSLSYVDSVLAKIQANAAGYDDALMVDGSGLVAEAAVANLFLVRDGALETPTTSAALHGITRETVFEIAADLSIHAVERSVTIGDVWTADEAFLTGTGAEIVPVVELDGRAIGDGQVGPVTKRVINKYQRVVRTRDQTPVPLAR